MIEITLCIGRAFVITFLQMMRNTFMIFVTKYLLTLLLRSSHDGTLVVTSLHRY